MKKLRDRMVRVGPLEEKALEKIADGLAIHDANQAGRMGVCVLDALYTAEAEGLYVRLFDQYGRQWEYSLKEPRKAHLLAKDGRRSGTVKILVPTAADQPPSTPRPTRKSRKLSVVK